MSAATEVYGTRPIKRHRRTKAAIEDIKAGLYNIVAASQPMTVRQVFYQATTSGLVEKTETAYKTTVARLLLEMRRSGEIPYGWIDDSTRWMRKPTTYSSLDAFITRHQHAYRRDLWEESPDYVEVWLEKDTLAGVIFDVTGEFDVPLMVARGFASESYIHSAAEAITDQLTSGKHQAFIYYFGDHDPSGTKIDPAIERGLRRMCAEMTTGGKDDYLVFSRVAVTPWQIQDFDLPTRPSKIDGNRHAQGWAEHDPSVEIDAIPPGVLRSLVREVIEDHVDEAALARIRQIEAEERQQLAMFGQQIATGEAAR